MGWEMIESSIEKPEENYVYSFRRKDLRMNGYNIYEDDQSFIRTKNTLIDSNITLEIYITKQFFMKRKVILSSQFHKSRKLSAHGMTYGGAIHFFSS